MTEVAASRYAAEVTDPYGILWTTGDPPRGRMAGLFGRWQPPWNQRFLVRVVDRASGVVVSERRVHSRRQAEERFRELEHELMTSSTVEFAGRHDPDQREPN